MKIDWMNITPENIKKNRWELINKLGKIRKRGSILEVLELEGSYTLENSSELYDDLFLGEKLAVSECIESPNKEMLTVKKEIGTIVGFLPIGISLLPRLLIDKGCKLSCYVEYKDYTNKLLTVCVSMYVEKY